jgi:cytochrome d ubiquinol oxidase subunit II
MLDWLTPFTLFCGLGLTIAYALLGATWLVMKSENPLQDKMRHTSRTAAGAADRYRRHQPVDTAGAAGHCRPLVHAAEPLFLLPVPLLVVALGAWLWRDLRNPDRHALPFILTLGLVFLGFSGLGISIWPHIPPGITLWQAAAPPQSQGFMLVGALLIIPVILGYTFWSYYVFRGKVQHGGVSLMNQSRLKQLLWMVALWGTSVLALGQSVCSFVFDDRGRAESLIPGAADYAD